MLAVVFYGNQMLLGFLLKAITCPPFLPLLLLSFFLSLPPSESFPADYSCSLFPSRDAAAVAVHIESSLTPFATCSREGVREKEGTLAHSASLLSFPLRLSLSLSPQIRSAAEIVTTIACLRLLLNHGIEISTNGFTNYVRGLVSRRQLHQARGSPS